MNLFKLLTVVTLLCINTMSFAEPSDVINSAVSVTMPINATPQQQASLEVKIPAGYRALESLSDFKNGKTKIVEYIPQNDPEYQWTQIITANQMLNQNIRASEVINFMIKRFQNDAKNVVVLEHKTTEYPNYQQSCGAIDYQINNRHEMIYMCYYSGPANSVGIQYAVLWPKDSSITTRNMLDQLRKFVEGHSQVAS